MKRTKILTLGATGMLGHTLLGYLSKRPEFELHATARSRSAFLGGCDPALAARVSFNVDAGNPDQILNCLCSFRPDLVINCIGIIKQLPAAQDPVSCITVNALFPHTLAKLCQLAGARLLHISTDCVFSGEQGNYRESDPSDAADLYGRSKFLGEVAYPHCITLRTSIIGHELGSSLGLVDWFLAQEGSVKGYTRAIFTGFPTVELARIIADFVVPNRELSGLYQVSSEPISKFELLQLVAKSYGKEIQIEPDAAFHCDRSLNSEAFRQATGYQPPSWPELVAQMHQDFSNGNPREGGQGR